MWYAQGGGGREGLAKTELLDFYGRFMVLSRKNEHLKCTHSPVRSLEARMLA